MLAGGAFHLSFDTLTDAATRSVVIGLSDISFSLLHILQLAIFDSGTPRTELLLQC